ILVLFLILFNTRSHGQATITSSETFINESKFISINGIDQWVTFKGNRAKPIILFLHGGPGSPISPYSDALYAGWEIDFILVQWGQRGSGRTYGRNAPPEFSLEYYKEHLLTVEQMTSDGISLTEYLLSNLKKSKVILFGTSWASVPGIKMAEKRPDLLYA